MRTARLAIASLLVVTVPGCFDRGGLDPIGDAGASAGAGVAGHGGGGGAGGKGGTAGAKGTGGTSAPGGHGGAFVGTGSGTAGASGGVIGTGGLTAGSGGRDGPLGSGGYATGSGGKVPSSGGQVGATGGGATGGVPGSGGAPAVCSGVICNLACPLGFETDSNGCPLCKCKPATCAAVACPLGQCPNGYATDVAGCGTCKCLPSSACIDADCGVPPPGVPVIACSNGSTAGGVCQRNATGMCSWQIVECPGGCSSINDSANCAAEPSCTWLVPGCAEPALATAGCYARTSLGCTSDADCDQGHQCLKRVINPCFNDLCMFCGKTQAVCQ